MLRPFLFPLVLHGFSALLSVCWAAKALAFSGELPRVINFPKTEYQAQNQNWMISESGEGFLYFANSAGLLEFDGARWTLYPLPDRQIMRSVACDREGRIFTGAFGEFGFWQRSPQGRLVYQSLSRRMNNKKAEEEEIWHILALDGRVIFQSFSTIFEYDYRAVRQVTPPGNIMFLQEVRGRVLVPVIGKGLYEWRGSNDFQFISGSDILAEQRVSSILPHPQGFLIGTEHGGLLLYDGRGFLPWHSDADALLRADQLNRAWPLPDGQLALGTILNGLYVLDAQGHIRYHINKENGLQNNTVLALRLDRSGNLWLGLDKGIDLAALNDPLVYFQDKSGQTGTTYTAVVFKNQLYLGTNQGVYVRPWKRNDPGPFRLLPGTQGQVWELTLAAGQLLCGHNDGTLLIEGDKATRISPVTGGWSTLFVKGDKRRLIQATYTGLVLLEKNSEGQWRFARRIGSFIQPLKQITFDEQGFLWGVHPYRGLYRFRLSPSCDSILEWRSFTKKDGLPSEFRLSLKRIGGRLAIRSDTTLLTWDTRDQQLKPYPVRQSTRSGMGKPLIIQGLGNEWFMVYPDRVTWMRNSDTLLTFPVSLVTDYENIVALDEGTYLLCLDQGYALLDRWLSLGEKPAPAPVIRQVSSLDNIRFSIGLTSPTETGRSLRLPARWNSLRFLYTLPYYAQQAQFRHRLVGFQDQWSEWAPTAQHEFTNLPQGNYIFEVQASLSPHITSCPFSIRPHWYQTFWANIAYLMLGAGFAFLLVRWHHYRLSRQRRRLELERERQLQQQRIRARNEQLQVDIINKSKQLANSTFNLIRKNEILLHLKEELNSLKNDSGGRSPEKYHRHLIQLIDRHLSSEQDWEVFESNFSQVHDAFFKSLLRDFPDLTPGDLKLAAYLKMNLSSKEIAPLLNISVRGVENKRYRLRRKLELDQDANLTEFLLNY